MGLKDKIDSFYVATCGNRITMVGTILITNHIFYSLYPVDGNLPAVLSILGGGIGGGIWGLTFGGISTWKHYKRTLKEAKENNKINPHFFEEKINKSENRKFIGYCQIQGLYLGAKRTNSLEEFYLAKNNVSNNIVPNF